MADTYIFGGGIIISITLAYLYCEVSEDAHW